MSTTKAIAKGFIGLVLGIASAYVLSPGIVWMGQSWGGASLIFYSIIVTGVILGLFAPTVRRAFGRGFLIVGVSLFALPLTVGMLTAQAASEVIAASSDSPATAIIGAGGGAALFTGLATFVGLILGSIFTIAGLVLALGGRREVVLVDRSVTSTRAEPVVSR